MRAVSEIVGLIDRYVFWLSVIVGITGWTYICCHSTQAAFHPSYRKHIHRFILLCSIATGGLVASVISDGVLTALRLFQTKLSFDSLIPIFSMAIEIVCPGVLIVHIRSITRRMASTAALLST
jgi:hypothetical protein